MCGKLWYASIFSLNDKFVRKKETKSERPMKKRGGKVRLPFQCCMLVLHFFLSLYIYIRFYLFSSSLYCYYADQKRGEAGSVAENQARIEVIAVNEWGIMIVRAGTVTDTMNEIAVMNASVTETETALTAMIPEVRGDHVHGQGIMIVTGFYFLNCYIKCIMVFYIIVFWVITMRYQYTAWQVALNSKN